MSKVHIILPPFENWNRILPRKAKALQAATGWSLSSKPDPSADFNYFMPYLAYVPVNTKAGAYFTHREDRKRQAKADLWDRVAEGLDLRLTSSRHNLPHLEPFGLTRLVTPPLDREKFCLAPRNQHGRPVVGTSGYVYPGGRKGEDLIAALRDSPTGRTVEWRASGRGWPIPTRGYLWEEMQGFYQYLNLYVCTSLIEGVGYGPLEALACGVPVIVPRGVGVFDDLPDLEGITRYRAGDADDLLRAFDVALACRPDSEALRAVTEPYSVEAWASGHVAAVESLLASKPEPAADLPAVVEETPEAEGKRGMYLVAFGEPARKCAIRCIESFKRHMSGVPVALVSDRPLGPEDILIKQAETDIGARGHKLNIYDLAPADWQYVLYLDADTETIAPLDFLFEALRDGWELAICKNPERFAVAQFMLRPDNHAECEGIFNLWGTDQLMQWNGGVFAFRRCDRVKQLFAKWREEWNRYGARDQGALLRVLHGHPVKALWLGNEWNLVPTYDPVERSAGIVHYPMTARRWSGVIHGRADSPEAWARVRQWERTQVGAKA